MLANSLPNPSAPQKRGPVGGGLGHRQGLGHTPAPAADASVCRPAALQTIALPHPLHSLALVEQCRQVLALPPRRRCPGAAAICGAFCACSPALLHPTEMPPSCALPARAGYRLRALGGGDERWAWRRASTTFRASRTLPHWPRGSGQRIALCSSSTAAASEAPLAVEPPPAAVEPPPAAALAPEHMARNSALAERLRGQLVLAPLTRGGHLPFRRLCSAWGAEATMR